MHRGDVEKEKEHFKTLKYLFVDGILYTASTEDVEHVKTIHREIPMVIVNRTLMWMPPVLILTMPTRLYQAGSA